MERRALNRPARSRQRRLCKTLLLAASAACKLLADATPPQDISALTLEELMTVTVTSVSQKEQDISRVGAAVFVLDSDDIRRSGATNIPDLLRLVPGVTVAQIDGHTWAISIRGFNATFANKVLVLIDGRRVYSPLTSGVNWDQQDVPLEDIERIEVIRGPGGTIWGANAVNGVINIITKKAVDTPGGLVAVGVGSHDAARDLAQYGGRIGANMDYRIFGGYSDTTSLRTPGGLSAPNSWHDWHFGGRSDWAISPRDNLTVQGDLSRMRSDDTATFLSGTRTDADAGNVLGRWSRTLAGGSDFALQAYFDHYDRTVTGSLEEIRNTVDVDFHHHLKIHARHDLIWGFEYRNTRDRTTGTIISFSPADGEDNTASAFVQDEITLTRSLSLTLGSKIEHNSYNDIEFEPSAQLVWRPGKRQEVWASVARALRDPSRADAGIHIEAGPVSLPNGAVGSLEIFGDPRQNSEELREVELGYRLNAGHTVSFDIATFGGLWRNLAQLEPGNPFVSGGSQPRLVVPLTYENRTSGNSLGGEAFATWRISTYWRVLPGFSFSHNNVDKGGAGNLGNGNSGYTTPRTQLQLRSQIDLPRHIEFDGTFAHTGALRDFGGGPIPAYTRVDVRVGKHLGDAAEISIVGQNLLTPRHTEFPDDSNTAHRLVARSLFAKITWRF